MKIKISLLFVIVLFSTAAYSGANRNLLDRFCPYWQDIPTGFLTEFTANAEELLKLDPDLVLVYGQFQREGTKNLSVPVLDFSFDNHDNEEFTLATYNFMKRIFEIHDSSLDLEKEWQRVKDRVSSLVPQIEEKQLKGLMIMNNTGNKITLRGRNTFGGDWLEKSGLENAAPMEGDSIEVAMEQIYQWNPDIIYVFQGIPAQKYLSNDIGGQDWSHTNAYKNRTIYDTPRGLMNWGAPNTDSPLMLQWLVSKNAPELLDESEFRRIMTDYYRRAYHLDLDDSLLESILNPNGM